VVSGAPSHYKKGSGSGAAKETPSQEKSRQVRPVPKDDEQMEATVPSGSVARADCARLASWARTLSASKNLARKACRTGNNHYGCENGAALWGMRSCTRARNAKATGNRSIKAGLLGVHNG